MALKFICAHCGQALELWQSWLFTFNYQQKGTPYSIENNAGGVYLCDGCKHLHETFFTYGKFEFPAPKLIDKTVDQV